MRDPLKNDDKQRIHDNIRRDPVTAISLFTYCYFLLSPETSITMGLSRVYATEERKKEQMDAILNNAEYLDILEDIMNRDMDVHFTLKTTTVNIPRHSVWPRSCHKKIR